MCLREGGPDRRIGPVHSISAVDLLSPERARFAPSIMGGFAMVGVKPLDEMLACNDVDDITVKEVLESIGCLGSETAGFAEIYGEQERIFERERTTIGAASRS